MRRRPRKSSKVKSSAAASSNAADVCNASTPMFDIGYSELLLTAIVALLVLGPERLPGAMRTTGLWVGRIRRSFDRIKQELEAEVGMDELRQQIHNDGILDEARRLKRDLNEAAQATRDVWHDAQHSILPGKTVASATETTATAAAAIATGEASAANTSDHSPAR